MANFKKARGVTAMTPAAGSGKTGGGNFCPSIRWMEDGEQKYIIFLNNIDELATVYLHEWVPVGEHPSGKTKFGFFIDRRDACIGEDTDELTDRLGQTSKRRTLAVAVELEPKFTTINGKQRPNGFEVKTDTYERKNENGGVEEVEYPVIGVVSQAWKNFFGYMASYDQTNNNIEETPFQITRRGKGSDTVYDHVPLAGLPVDYNKLLEHIGAVGYMPEFVASDDAKETAMQIGNLLLDKYLEELADKDTYDEQVGPIEFIENKWGDNKSPKINVAQASLEENAPVAIADPPGESKADRLRKKYAGQTA